MCDGSREILFGAAKNYVDDTYALRQRGWTGPVSVFRLSSDDVQEPNPQGTT